MKARLRPKSWFEAYAFKDLDDNYWITAKVEETLGIEYTQIKGIKKAEMAISPDMIGGIIDVDYKTIEHIQWGVEELYTREDDPEYFI